MMIYPITMFVQLQNNIFFGKCQPEQKPGNVRNIQKNKNLNLEKVQDKSGNLTYMIGLSSYSPILFIGKNREDV